MSYPSCVVQFSEETLRANATETVFDALRDLNIDEAVSAIMRPKGSDGDHSLFVGVSEESSLFVGFDLLDTFVMVQLAPSSFDRTDPEQNAVLQKCATLAQAIHESPLEAGAGNPGIGKFSFWKWPEVDVNNDAAQKWAKMAELWTIAAQTPGA